MEHIIEWVDRVVSELGIKSHTQLSPEVCKKPIKEISSAWLYDSLIALRSVSVEFLKYRSDTAPLQSELIRSQKQIIDLQAELLACKNEQLACKNVQLQSVQSSVKTTVEESIKAEFDTYSSKLQSPAAAIAADTVSGYCSPDKLKEAIRSVVVEEDRSRNVVIFNKEEHAAEDVSQIVSSVLEDINEKPRIIECRRIGKPHHGKPRPIKVKLTSSDAVAHILRKAKDLKSSGENKSTFIGPDRTAEERKENRALVEQLKEKIKAEPGLYHFIRRGHIFSIEKNANESTKHM